MQTVTVNNLMLRLSVLKKLCKKILTANIVLQSVQSKRPQQSRLVWSRDNISFATYDTTLSTFGMFYVTPECVLSFPKCFYQYSKNKTSLLGSLYELTLCSLFVLQRNTNACLIKHYQGFEKTISSKYLLGLIILFDQIEYILYTIILQRPEESLKKY